MADLGKSTDLILKKPNYTRQYVSAIIGSLQCFTTGMVVSWIAPALLVLKNENSNLEISNLQSSILSSSYQIGIIPGTIFAFILNDFFGRKKSILIASAPFIINCLILILFEDVTLYCIARFFGGLGSGITAVTVPLYLCEIASPDIRGLIAAISVIINSLGSITIFFVLPLVSIKLSAFIIMISPIFVLFSSFLLEESPYYLLKVKKITEAKEVLAKLRSNDLNEIEEEIKHMNKNIEMQQNQDIIAQLKENRRGLYILTLVCAMTQMVGINGVNTYFLTILETVPTFIDTQTIGTLIYILASVVPFITCYVIDKLGRRPTILSSNVLTGIPTFMIAVFFYIKSNYDDTFLLSYFSWAPGVLFFLYYAFYTFGLAIVPHLYVGELLNTKFRAFGGALMSIYTSILGILFIYFHQIVADIYGTHVIFFIYLIIIITNTFLIYIYVPETKGLILDNKF